MRRFGSVARKASPAVAAASTQRSQALTGRKLYRQAVRAQHLPRLPGVWSISGCCCGFRPILSRKAIRSGVSSKLLAESALIAFPTVFVARSLYSRWSTKWSLVTMIA